MKIYSLHLLFFLLPIAIGIPFGCNESLEFKASTRVPVAGVANILFKSPDGGQTWLDISKGLPGNLREDSIRGNSFYANDKGLFLRVGNELYHNKANATVPVWTKEIFPVEHCSIAPG